ncbi:hypothetical protein KY308_04040 [Candidatus Woesearchaeota archaeon]|nr:hypothetical protein [Candidatus Woesearchaeota archaeon]
MKLELIEKKEVPLLSRTRVQLKAEFDKATPKRDDIRKEVAKKVGSDEKLTIVKHIYTQFGNREAKVIAHIYKKEEDMRRIEDKPAVKRNVKEEPKAEAAEAPEAKAEEKPAEVKAEEKPAEAKAE